MFGGFKFAPSTARLPGHPIFQPRPIARKCIVCGTTKIESQMKPFLLKGEQLNAWTQSYFYHKRPKLFGFYAKLRYTINPYACTEHFTMSGPIPRVRNPMLRSTPNPLSKARRQTSLLAKMGKRNCSDLLSDGEEPPSIQKIIEKKPSPPPEAPKAPRSEKEVTDAVMAILKAAREEMDKEEEKRKMLRKITRRIKINADGSQVMRRKKKKKRRMRRVERDTEREPMETRIVDGNEPDSDNSEGTIDVEAVDSDAERSASASSDSGSSSYETDSDSDAEVVAPAPAPPRLQPMQRMRQPGFIPLSRRRPQLQLQQQHRPPPPPMVVVPRRPIPKRPYLIAEPPGQKKASPLIDGSRAGLLDGSRLDGSARPPTLLLHPAAVPKRLTLTTPAGTGANYLRPSWVAPNPGQKSLASVLQKFWNEDSPPSSSSSSFARPMQRPRQSTARFGQTVLPGTKTKFKPAAISAPTLFAAAASSPSPTTPHLHHPSIRTSALLNNPPLSPSRIIIGSEETVVTTRESDDETKTMVMSSSSSSASSSEESDVEVEVCDHSAAERPPVEGQKIEPIEDMEEQLRSRTVSTVLSNSSGETVTSEDEEIDVETVDETSDKGDRETAMDTVDLGTVAGGEATPLLLADEDTVDPPGPMERTDRRKQRMPSSAMGMGVGTRVLHHAMAARTNIILPPSALVKPPTRLLSSGQYSMKDLLHAQARAAAGQPVRINTTGLVYAPKRPPAVRPKDMPRLPVETRGESEWARLERIVEQKMADHRAKLEADKKRAQLKLVDQQLMSENPPPELERETDDEAEGKGEIAQLMESMEGRKVLRMTFHDKKDNNKKEDVGVSRIKVLDRSTRPLGVIREEVVATCEDDSDPASSPPPMDQMVARTKEWKDKRAKREIFGKKAAKQREVRNPTLIINKDELMGIKLKRKNVPPPTPIVGIPAPEEYAARREMFDKKRLEVKVLAGLRFGKQRSAREQLKAWQRQKMMVGMIRRGMRDVNLHEEEDEEEDKEEATLVAESLAIVKRAKEEKQKAWILEEIEERKRRMRRGKEAEMEEGGEEGQKEKDVDEEKEDEEMILVLSDIEHDEAGEGRGGKRDKEEMEMDKAERQRARAMSADGEWKMKGAARGKKEEEEEGETRRKSHRLRVKREALPKSERRLIWKGSDDDEEEEEEEEEEVTPTPDTPSSSKEEQPLMAVVDAGKRKRGRPRKNPPAPPPKRKRVSKVMTAKEKEVLSRVLAPVEKSDDLTMDEPDKDGEEDKEMGGGSGMEMLLSLIDDNGATEEDGVREEGMDEDIMEERQRAEAARRERELEDMREMEQLEVQTPKAADDAPVPPESSAAAKRRRMPWSWSQRLSEDVAVNAEMGGRLCNYCMKHQKRYIWIPNEAMALMDHARTHCVETLMCPSKDCTYMNTHRSRIAQHVSYVHKKWGMPIDLSEVYPSMRKSLMMRLRHCFPDLPNVAVCLLCRVAVRIDADEFRWHAQSHLETSVFECSRNICTLKFSTEQECIDHIQQANCRGSVVSGMTDEMEDEVTELVERCFPGKVLEQQDEQAADEGEQPDAVPDEKEDDDGSGDLTMMEEEEDGEAHSSTPSVSPSKSASQEMECDREKKEEERENAVRDEPMDQEETGEMEQPCTSQ